jgi:DNA gyrase/topoisomerase IV subunit B
MFDEPNGFEHCAVTTALSEWLDFTARQDGNRWYQAYERGVPKEPLQITKQTKMVGTEIRFKIDPTIIAAQDFDLDQLISWCKGKGGPEYTIMKYPYSKGGRNSIVIPATT